MRERSDSRPAKKVEIAAVRLLARREHSIDELKRKLIAKGHAAEDVEQVVARLAAKRLVSDERYVASFVQSHIRRGQGPVRIRAELRQQGVDAEAVDRALEAAEVDFGQLAREVRARKFGSKPPRTLPERAKQARFLQYRGFTADQIRAALGGGDGGAPEHDPDSSDPGWLD
jgi:regulatory protein